MFIRGPRLSDEAGGDEQKREQRAHEQLAQTDLLGLPADRRLRSPEDALGKLDGVGQEEPAWHDLAQASSQSNQPKVFGRPMPTLINIVCEYRTQNAA